MRLRASFPSPAPMRWAHCTVKPMPMEPQRPPKSQVVEATRPMAADPEAPRLPTMEASIYCMTTEEIWARIAGMLNRRIITESSGMVRVSPFLNRAR